MNKFFLSVVCSIAFNSLIAKNTEKEPERMTDKIVQVEIIVEEKSKDLESNVNKFLVSKKIQKEDLIDIKFSSTSAHRRVLIIYEINYSEKK